MSKTPYFDYQEGNQTYQVWYDDPQSLHIKYQVTTIVENSVKSTPDLLISGGYGHGSRRGGVLDWQFPGLLQQVHGGGHVVHSSLIQG